MATPGVTTCAQCGTQIAPALLSCPLCHALVHAETLKALVARAEDLGRTGDRTGAIAIWRQVLELLPEGTGQHAAVTQRINALGQAIDQAPAPAAPSEPQSWLRRSWAAIAAGAIFLATKAKLLLLGLTKLSTLGSMLVFLGVYWSLWGWKFALGFVLGIYIHEMGHVAALARYGIAASAPMFIPGLGAVVRLKQRLTDVRQDARVGLAGPIWGLAAGLVAYAVGRFTGSDVWLAIGQATGFINLFNLIPFWQLDGGRGFHALSKAQRVAAAVFVAVVWSVSGQGLLVLLLALAVFQAFGKAPETPDHGTLATYAALVAVLAWLSRVPVSTLR